MKKKLLAALMTFAIVLTIIAPLTAQASIPGWEKEANGKWKFYDTMSSYYTDSIQKIGDEFYAFDEEGWMQVGWFKRSGNWYYAKSSGALASGWEKVNGKWYYFEPNLPEQYRFIMHSNEFLWDGSHKYYLSESGAMQTGWIYQVEYLEDGTSYSYWMYADSSGIIMQDGWLWIKDAWYYFSPYGTMYSGGIYHIDSVPYYFYPNGKMGTGWIKSTYSFDDGESLTDWFYADSSGVIQTKWKKIDGIWYYFNEYYGDMFVGSHEINGQWYVFLDSGAWVSWPGWVKVTYQNGYWDWFYTDSSGTPQFGWQKIGGIWYYFYDYDASMAYSTTEEIDGHLYAFDQNGALMYGNGWRKLPQWDGSVLWVYLENNYAKTGWLDGGNGIWYYLHPYYGFMEDVGCKTGDYLSLFYPNGVWKGYYTTPGWKKVGVDWYYINSDGTLKSGWLTYNGKQYYLDPDFGYMFIGWHTIGETDYEFDDDGALIP